MIASLSALALLLAPVAVLLLALLTGGPVVAPVGIAVCTSFIVYALVSAIPQNVLHELVIGRTSLKRRTLAPLWARVARPLVIAAGWCGWAFAVYRVIA